MIPPPVRPPTARRRPPCDNVSHRRLGDRSLECAPMAPSQSSRARRLPWFLAALLATVLHGAAAWSFGRPRHPQPVYAEAIAVELIAAEQPASPPAPPARTPPPAATPRSKPPMPRAVATTARKAPEPAAAVEPVGVVAAANPTVPDAAPAHAPERAAPVPNLLPPDLAVHCPHRTAPTYPPAARRRGLQGSVTVRVTLGSSGRVESVSVERSSGVSALDLAALGAVRRWRCQPLRVGGEERPSVLRQRFDFALH